MLIGDWYVDEFGILTREIRARDQGDICVVRCAAFLAQVIRALIR
jgi:hypothetical protein